MPKTSRRTRPDKRRSLSTDVVALRLTDFMQEQGLRDPLKTQFIEAVCPWYPAWLDDLPRPGQISLGTLVARFERCAKTLAMDTFEDLQHFIQTVAQEQFALPPEGTPTGCVPGSEAKVQVLIARAERGEALFQRGDVGLPDYLAFVSIARGREIRRLRLVDARTPKAGQRDGGDGEGNHVPPR